MKLLHTHHFGVMQNAIIPDFKKVLSGTCKRFIKYQEKRLEASCSSVWWQRNHLNETFLFGRFNTGKNQWIPVTLAYYHENVGWITMKWEMIEFRLTSDPEPHKLRQ